MSIEPNFSTPVILEALKSTMGKVYLAAAKLGCQPCTIYRRAREEWSIKQAIINERGMMVDLAEIKLKEALMEGESWAIIKVLESLGRKRGYGKITVDHKHTGQVTQEVKIRLHDVLPLLSVETKRQIVEAMRQKKLQIESKPSDNGN